MEYILIEIFFFAFLIFLQKFNKIKLFKTKKHVILFWTVIILVGVVWDQIAIARGHWMYPGKGILGVFIGKMPIEDYLFIVLIPYGSLIAYHLFGRKNINNKKKH